MRKTLEALFYLLWQRFHRHEWKYQNYASHLDGSCQGPYRNCAAPGCGRIERWGETP